MMQAGKQQRSRVGGRWLQRLGHQRRAWSRLLSCCMTRNKAYYTLGWSNIGQEPPFGRKSIYLQDMAHLAIREQRRSFKAPFFFKKREKKSTCVDDVCVTDLRDRLNIDLLEETFWTGFSGALWCTASSFTVEFSIVSVATEDTGRPGGEAK